MFCHCCGAFRTPKDEFPFLGKLSLNLLYCVHSIFFGFFCPAFSCKTMKLTRTSSMLQERVILESCTWEGDTLLPNQIRMLRNLAT